MEAPAALSLNGAAEGLDATAVLPPLLRPGMLTDPDGYDGWEREAVATFNDRSRGARDALAVIAAATDEVRAWQPGGDSLATRVSEAFHRARSSSAPPEGEPSSLDRGIKAFLAAHLFASWSAYQDDGLGRRGPRRRPCTCDPDGRAPWRALAKDLGACRRRRLPCAVHRGGSRRRLSSEAFTHRCPSSIASFVTRPSTPGPMSIRRPSRAPLASWCSCGCWPTSCAPSVSRT